MSNQQPYNLGVEIEIIVKPKDSLGRSRRHYYGNLAESLQKRQLDAVADGKADTHRQGKHRRAPQDYDKWWITDDASLRNPNHPLVPLEAVSPIFFSDGDWARDIKNFWRACGAVFYKPELSPLCGCHVHISPYAGRFTLGELRSIAFGVVFYEPLVEQLLPAVRVDNGYCRSNTKRSTKLSRICYGSDTSSSRPQSGAEVLRKVWQAIYKVRDAAELSRLMQGSSDPAKDRRVLFNFENTLPGKSGTIEFRGGPGLRGPGRTKMWMAFAVSFIRLCQSENYSLAWFPGIRWLGFLNSGPKYLEDIGDDWDGIRQPSMDRFWRDIRHAAASLGVKRHLPMDWTAMSQSPDLGFREKVVGIVKDGVRLE